jgi:hypothetical protein
MTFSQRGVSGKQQQQPIRRQKSVLATSVTPWMRAAGMPPIGHYCKSGVLLEWAPVRIEEMRMDGLSLVNGIREQVSRGRDAATDNVLRGGVREVILDWATKAVDRPGFELGIWAYSRDGGKVTFDVQSYQAASVAAFSDGKEDELHPALRLLAEECRLGGLSVRCVVIADFTGLRLGLEL